MRHGRFQIGQYVLIRVAPHYNGSCAKNRWRNAWRSPHQLPFSGFLESNSPEKARSIDLVRGGAIKG